MIYKLVNQLQTYYFSKQHHILSSDDEYSTGNVAKFLPNVNPFNGLVKHQIGWRGNKTINGFYVTRDDKNKIKSPTKLINAPEETDQRSSISEQHQVLL